MYIIIIIIVICLILLSILIIKLKFKHKIISGGNDIQFPYLYNILSSPQTMMKRLQNQTLKTTGSKHMPILERVFPDDYFAVDAISNHFTEYARVNCRVTSRQTPMEVWDNNKNDITNINIEDQREFIYNNTKECNTFNPALVKWIIESVNKPKIKILDPSSGWGDRLIGAISSSSVECYHGCDPNPKLQRGYSNIIKTFKKDPKKFYVLERPFEETSFKKNYYDIAMTSPPYYSYEEYVSDSDPDGKNQSIVKYKNYNDWVSYMYIPYITNMYNCVKHGGLIVIYIEDIYMDKKYPLRQLTIDTVKSLGGQLGNIHRYGLRVTSKLQKHKKAKVRWALAWTKI